ncbi:MAG TPA: c-type cytochrome [Vicinamibacterales bacterium]|nr:c-type cytochrome [Vicinamibacterales bacterium]
MRRGWPTLLALVPAALLLSACGSKANSLAPHSPQEKSIASLFWWMTGACFVGLGVITALLVLAWARRNRMGPGREPGERAGWLVVIVFGIGVMVAGVTVLFFFSDVHLIGITEEPAAAETELTVDAIGHQWYWEFRYPGTPNAVTADEMHIPVRTPVRVNADTADVVHEVWVPQLNRKIDTIPGQSNAIELYADQVGRYRGVCNQYCGLQHAHMDFWVYVDPPATFRAWLRRQAADAAQPSGAQARAGKRVFLAGSCSSCHTIRGTPADGTVGPDLTHLASRTSLAGLVLPNHRADLAAWITDAQHFKPGNQMPDIDVPPAQLRRLVAYLEGLK